jgi:hypothetical protein
MVLKTPSLSKEGVVALATNKWWKWLEFAIVIGNIAVVESLISMESVALWFCTSWDGN